MNQLIGIFQKISVYFSASNFMHLCGVKYEKNSHSFFDDCLNSNIMIDKIMIKKDGTTFQKLQVLTSVSELLGEHVYLTEGCRYLYLEFDYSLRTNKQILALTLKNDFEKVVPQSLLNLKQKNSFPKGEKVIKIYSEELVGNSQRNIIFKR
ncbi:PBECR4 domain-containing protein [Streptococcus uberis]|uniref:PBECR4 domain-containing protein n=1 Tax=Streptococcus uberis TaxID=1349 RepID=UPI00389297B2